MRERGGPVFLSDAAMRQRAAASSLHTDSPSQREAPKMVSSARFESEVAGILTEIPDFEDSALVRAERVLAAMATLRDAGFTLLLLPPETSVCIKRKSWFRRWWRNL